MGCRPILTLVHSEWPKIYGVLAILSAKELRDHLREGQKLAAEDRWPLNTGLFTLYFGSRDLENVAALDR